jgi:hypothetical protein
VKSLTLDAPPKFAPLIVIVSHKAYPLPPLVTPSPDNKYIPGTATTDIVAPDPDPEVDACGAVVNDA